MSSQYDAWIGRTESRTEDLHASVVQAMAATLDVPAAREGEPLPAGWQWLFFNPVVPRSGLGDDGHPRRGGFLPPIDLPRRMWAGSRLRYLADLPVGAQATRESRILGVQHKVGKRGALWFVTLRHTIACEGEARIVEEQDIVYREASPPGAAAAVRSAAQSAAQPASPPAVQPRARSAAQPNAAAAPPAHEAQAQWSQPFAPDPVLLFRYSALTFNGHRIHYDQDYARQVEGYPDLVVHGPLTATLLQRFAVDRGGGRALARFEFRGVSPLFVSRAFRLEGREADDGSLELWARGPDGELAVSAVAAFR